MKAKYSLFFFLIIFGLSLTFSSEISSQPSRRISIEDGLPSNSIRCIFKAKNGLLWIGTDAGLCKYDGKNITVFDEKNGLPSNYVWSIADDEKGNLWIGCYSGGISYYNGSSFKTYTNENGLPSKRVRKLRYEDGILFISTDSKLVLFDGENFHYKPSMMQVMGVEKVDSSLFVISRALGVYKLSYKKNELSNFSLDSCGWYGSMFGGLSTNKGLLLFKNKLLRHCHKDSMVNCYQIQSTIKSNSVTWSASEVNDSTIYLAQWGVNENNGGLSRLVNEKVENVNALFGVDSKQVVSTYYDRLNNILWVGTLDKGIYILFLNEDVKYPKLDSKKEVFSIEEDKDGSFWCLKPGGLCHFKNQKMQLVFSYESFKNIIKKSTKWKKKIGKSKINKDLVMQALNNFRLYQMQLLGDELYISSDHGIFKYNTVTKTWKHKLLIGSVFFVDSSNVLTFHHPYSYVRRYQDPFNSDDKITYKELTGGVPLDVTQIVNFKGNLWYASRSNGLHKQKDSLFISFLKNKQFSEVNINHLITAEDSLLILSTQSGNIYCFSEQNDELKLNYKISDNQIKGNYIYFISYLKNKLFIGTNLGLNIFQNGTVSFLDKMEGYFNNEILCYENINESIYLGSPDGLTVIDSELNIIQNDNSINLNLLRTIDSSYSLKEYESKELILNYNQNYFTIDFSYPNLINTPKDNFEIEFSVMDNNGEWVSSSNAYKDPDKCTVRFLNLDDGAYRIRILVNNIHSNESKTSDYFYFTIKPPYWTTLSFYIIVIVCISLILGFLISKKIEEITLKEKSNRRIAEVRLEALKSQMNPHFTFNVMNSIQNYIVDNDVDQALYFIGSFSKLVRNTLDYSFKKSISLNDEIQFLKNYVEIQNMRFGNKVNFEVEFPEKFVDKIRIPPMIIQPLIENVFVHAFNDKNEDPLLKLSISLDAEIHSAEFINIVVSDNGVGRHKSKDDSKHISRGLKIIEERLVLLNKANTGVSNLNYKDLSNGTEVHLKLPLLLSF